MGALVVLLLAAAAGGLWLAREHHAGPFALDPEADNPFAAYPQHVQADTRTSDAAAQAAADGDDRLAGVLDRLAAVPQGIWLTPEQHPPGEVGEFVAGVVAAADEAGTVPVLVVYGVPDRDCTGGYSAGGLAAEEYGPWVGEIAGAAGTADAAVVVLEPDAVASATQCEGLEERLGLLAAAVEDLRAAGVTTYLDGGHSAWVPAEELAPLLRQAGVESVRGFATNVSNYQTDDDERAYAERLSELLGGAHYVIDRGRNGNGATDDWCNPPGRAFGKAPGFVDDDTGLDAFLWVKPPAESDGECHGGPPAGEVWPQRALEMAEASGW